MSNRLFHSVLAGLLTIASAQTAFAETFVTARGTNAVLVFADDATGNTAPLRVIRGSQTQFPLNGLNGIAVDIQEGEIFVSTNQGRILVFDINANGNVAPLRSITGPATGLQFVAGIAIDAINDELYAVDLTGNGLRVFPSGASGNVAPLRTIRGFQTGIIQPTGVFVDLEADEVYVTNESGSPTGIGVFPRLGNGNIPPVRRIQGPATTIDAAVGVFRNPVTDLVMLADLSAGGEILTFAPDANGNVPPLASLTSSSMQSAGGLTFTHDNELLAVDVLGSAILTFDMSDTGPSAPLRNLRGPQTMIVLPIYTVSTNSPFPGSVSSELPLATALVRSAAANPNSYEADGVPSLGSLVTLSVDTASTGHTTASIFASFAPAEVPIAGGLVLLLGGSIFPLTGALPGPTVNVPVAVPAEAVFAGLTISTQALLTGGAPNALTNAVDLTIGL